MLFHPTYFSSILQYALMIKSDKIEFEIHDNYQKQTYRNRSYILGANGKQLLNIPTQKVSGKQLTRDVKIDYSSNWQSEHLKTLYSAYNSSPFFEFYIDDLLELFQKKETYLLDLNFKTLVVILQALQVDISYSNTSLYQKEEKKDARFLVNSKLKLDYIFPKYTQVFDSKLDFEPNLSILDLLFMEGPASLIYLEKIDFNVFI